MIGRSNNSSLDSESQSSEFVAIFYTLASSSSLAELTNKQSNKLGSQKNPSSGARLLFSDVGSLLPG